MERTLAFAVIALLFAGSAQAQVLGAFQGHVTDEQGGILPGATVTIDNTETGAQRVVVTDGTGFYNVQSLPSGVYTATASLSGMQSGQRENVRLLVAQVLGIDLQLSVGGVFEEVTVVAEAPVVEGSRSSIAIYVTEEEIDNLPISGRDYVNFALLSPTVKIEPNRDGISLSGQKGVSSGLKIDGTEAKSAFYGYARGGEATENDGLVIAQDSVKEFQVVTNGFTPEYGSSGGGYMNVLTKSGTNVFSGSVFGYFRNEGMVAALRRSPVDEANAISADDDRFTPDEFDRKNWGGSFGGPIVKDKTHFFLSFDQNNRDTPAIATIRSPTAVAAVRQRFPSLLDGYTDSADGAVGTFTTQVDNNIFFGKLTHQLASNNTVSFRYNLTDFKVLNDNKSVESLKTEKAHSFVTSLVSVIGSRAVNEFRFQFATDGLDRNSNLDPGDPRALIRISTQEAGRVQFGKLDFLPIFVREKKFQFQDTFLYIFENHDLKFGVDFQTDDSSEFFAGSADGRYDFNSPEEFLANSASRARIYFGSVANPNFEVTQQLLGVFAQDTWRASDKLTMNYGVRWDATFNPQDIPHVIPGASEIPDDTNNIAPRLGFTYTPGGDRNAVIRGGFGIFYSRTPMLIFFNQYQDNGIFPNFGRVTISPSQIGFVTLGTTIDNENPPAGLIPALAFVEPDFDDATTVRANLGYEQEIAPSWVTGLDLAWARGYNLQSAVDTNVFQPVPDEFGRPIFPDGRPDSNFSDIRVRTDDSRSNYYSATVRITKRWLDGFQVQAHYTWSRDESNDDNERSATSITVTNLFDYDYDYGLSSRDITHRFVLSGIVALPLDFKLAGIAMFQSGTPYTALDPNDGLNNLPGDPFRQARAVINSVLVERNSFRNSSFENVDLRLTKFFDINDVRIELIAEAFNLFNFDNFEVSASRQEPTLSNGANNSQFGLASVPLGLQRQFQLGTRIQF